MSGCVGTNLAQPRILYLFIHTNWPWHKWSYLKADSYSCVPGSPSIVVYYCC